VAAAGAFTGLAALTHVNGLLLLIPLAIGLWDGPLRPSRRAIAAPALMLVVAAVVIAPWAIRNAVTVHAFVPISDETGITLVGTYNAASAADHQVPYKWRLFTGIPADRAVVRELPRTSEVELDSRLTSQALNYIADHPVAPLAVAAHNTLRLLELEGSFAWRSSAAAIGLDGGTARIGVIGFWILLVLAVCGAFTGAARGAPLWVWLVPVLLALSVVLVNVETPRFRAPIDPFLVMLAACAVASALARLAGRRAPGGALARGAPVGRRLESTACRGDGELVQMVERLA
jgi:hypothetical protein